MNLIILFFFCFFCISLSLIEFIGKKSIVSFLFIGIFFAFCAAFRGSYVPDTIAYINSYKSLNSSLFDFNSLAFEPGFVFFSKLQKCIFGGSYQLYFFIITLLNLFVIYKVIETLNKEINFTMDYKMNMRLYVTPLVLYISFYGFYFNFIILRAGIACSFLLYSWIVFNQNKVKSIISFFLALLFHTSIVFSILAFPFLFKKNSIKQSYQYLWIFIIGVIYFTGIGHYTTFIFIDLFGKIVGRYAFYIKNISIANEAFSTRFIINYFIAFGLIWLNRKELFFNRLLNIFLTGLTLLSLLSGLLLVERITDFYLSVSFLLIYIGIFNFKTWKDKIIIFSIIMLVYVFFVMRIVNKPLIFG
jgi:energy-converting hydrogenase Eha subunit A